MTKASGSPPPLSTEITDGFAIGGASWTLGLALWIGRATWFAPFVFVVPAWKSGDALQGAITRIMAAFIGTIAGLRGRSIVGLAGAGVGLAATFIIPTFVAGYRAGALQALAPGPLPAIVFLALATYWLAKRRGRRPIGVSRLLLLATVAGWAVWGYFGMMSMLGP